jgi:MFS family permease
MKKDLFLLYCLSFISKAWFWSGIWILYYLRFTTYAGIGAVESVMIVNAIFCEIPTGAISDLIGRKKSLVMAFLLICIGNFVLASAPNVYFIGLATIVIVWGAGFYSGTLEASYYDLLKRNRQSQRYQKVISFSRTLEMISIALCGIIGGFLYSYSPTLPFWLSGVVAFIGVPVALCLSELGRSKEYFSLKSFWKQNKVGYHELFKNEVTRKYVFLILSTGFFMVMAAELMNDALAIEFGFRDSQLGVLTAAGFLFAAVASHSTHALTQLFGKLELFFLASASLAVAWLISPYAQFWLGGGLFILAICLMGIVENVSSAIINPRISSQYRATTLSTLEMLRKAPYVLLAFVMGGLMDVFSARNFAFMMGAVLLILLFLQLPSLKFVKMNHK